MSTNEKPTFKHDCKVCRFVGKLPEVPGTATPPFDVYVCPSKTLPPTLLARYGDDGDQYASLALFPEVLRRFAKNPEDVLARAYVLAKSRNAIPEESP